MPFVLFRAHLVCVRIFFIHFLTFSDYFVYLCTQDLNPFDKDNSIKGLWSANTKTKNN